MIRVPLYRRGGVIAAYALIDDADGSEILVYRWHMSRHGYARRRVDVASGGGVMSMHRQLLGLPIGDPRQCDHRNRDKLDNRRSNLRVVTAAQNRQNVDSYAGSVSRHRGVSFHKRIGKWVARARLDGRLHNLGYFATEQEAADVAAEFRAEYMPFSEEAAA